MKEKLTKKRALELCLELWTWLSENPKSAKHEWPGWEKHKDIYLDCFACEYVCQQSHYSLHKLECNKCPLLELWGDCDEGDFFCENSLTSPFKKWGDTGGSATKSRQAKRIVNFCKKELKRKDL